MQITLSKRMINLETNYYLRDAQGNIMANYLYRDITTDDFILAGHEIYGSSRVGTTNANKTLWTAQEGILTDQANHYTFTRGAKSYELSNHLGNVLAVISDRKLAVDANNNDTTDYYTADVQSRQMYYSFGMIQPNTQNLSGNYKYGFNGKESDDEVSGTGNQYDYGFRIYNPRLGRFLSVDPLTSSYPWYTPYQFAGNKPIWAVDIDGLEEFIYIYLFQGNDKPALFLYRKENVSEDGTTNLTTKLPFTDKELGTLQYRYLNASGENLNIKRNYKGIFTEGVGDILDEHTKGMFNTIYTGKNNPLTPPDELGKQGKDYRYEPVNAVDQNSLTHDHGIDGLGISRGDYWKDPSTLPYDNQLMIDSWKTFAKSWAGKSAPNGKPITLKEGRQAATTLVLMSVMTAPSRVNYVIQKVGSAIKNIFKGKPKPTPKPKPKSAPSF
jgi:RHS repeat-associated protein